MGNARTTAMSEKQVMRESALPMYHKYDLNVAKLYEWKAPHKSAHSTAMSQNYNQPQRAAMTS